MGLPPQPLVRPLDTKWGLMGLDMNSAAQGGGRAGDGNAPEHVVGAGEGLQTKKFLSKAWSSTVTGVRGRWALGTGERSVKELPLKVCFLQ